MAPAQTAEISSVRSAAGAPPVLSGGEATGDGTIESQAGEIVGQYSCVYEAINGVLYAGTKALYFVGTYFLFDKKIRLPWELIRQVVKMDQGVQILTKMDDVHTFGSMRQAEKVWPVLINLHNDALLDRKVVTVPSPVDRTRSMVRRNSDPASTAQHVVDGPPLPTPVPFPLENDSTFGHKNTSDLIGDDEDDDDDNHAKGPDSSKNNEEALKKVEFAKQAAPTKQVPPKKKVESTKKVASVKKPESAPKPEGSKKSESATKLEGSRKPEPAKKPAASVKPKPKLTEAQAVSFPVSGLSPEETSEKVGDKRLPPIHCTYDNVKGTLFVGNNGAYFFGRRHFFNVQKLFFPFGAIKQVQIVRSAPGICFTNQEGHVFAFTDMEDPDEVWASMLAFHQKITAQKEHAKAKQSMRGGGTSRRGSIIRMNSDPNMGTPMPLDGLVASKSRRVLKRLETPVDTPVQPSVDFAKAWEACESKKKDFPNLVVDKLSLECSLDSFFDRFFSDDAKYSLATYLESRGDSELKASKWEKGEKTPGVAVDCQKRTVNYKHPVNAPLAPPQAGARKEQTLTRFGKHGICMNTRTIVDDVPMADCFHVDDRIRVEPKGPEEVLVTMEFEITFVKSTMFKSIITKTTKTEFSDFFRQMGEYMTQALGGEPKPPPEEPEPAVPVPAEPTSFASLRGGVIPLVHPAFTLLVVFLQLFILREMRAMRSEFVALQKMTQVPASACLENVVQTALGQEDQETLAKAEL